MDPSDPRLVAYLARVTELGRRDTGADDLTVCRVAAPGHGEVLYATAADVARLEEASFALGEGPVPTALATRARVVVDDVDAPEVRRRWPLWATAVAETGVRCVAVHPVGLGAVVLGAVSFHRCAPGPVADDQLVAGRALADSLALALLDDLGRVPFADADHADGSTARRDLASTRVYQASGMVMVQLGVDSTQALLALRVRAYAEGRPLRYLADDVLARRVRFGPEDLAPDGPA